MYKVAEYPGTLEEYENSVSPRVQRNFELATKYVPVDETQRFAIACMMSEFYYLEEIAVMAALKGDQIPGQLEDEFSHRESFRLIADHYGGLQAPSDEVVELLSYLDEQQGAMSIAMLNIVGESWLETVFDAASTWGYFDEFFEIIREEEERHVHDAWNLELPPPEEVEPVVRDLEKLLGNIMASYKFTLPMVYVCGAKEASKVGVGICKAHEKACAHLGITDDVKEIEASCRAQIIQFSNLPEKLEMNNWEKTRVNLWREPAPMVGFYKCRFLSKNSVKNTLLMVQAACRVLDIAPEFKKVVRNNQLYQTKKSVVGFRFRYDEDHISNVFIEGASKYTLRKLISRSNKIMKKIRAKEFVEIPYFGEYLQLMPPSRCPVSINYNDGFGFNVHGPLNNVEGIPIQVMVGQLEPKIIYNQQDLDNISTQNGTGSMNPVFQNLRHHVEYEATVSVTMDHRVGDGKDISKFGRLLYEQLNKIQGIQ